LKIAIFHQLDLTCETDILTKQRLDNLVCKHTEVEFRIITVDYTEAKNAYYARFRVQQLYQGETYQL